MPERSAFAPNSWEARDLRAMLHGFSHLGSLMEGGPVVINRGEGIYVEDVHGKRYLEGNSGLWNMVLGFDHAGLMEAACEQIRRFPAYHAFFGRVSDTAVAPGGKALGDRSGAHGQGVLHQLGLGSQRHRGQDVVDDQSRPRLAGAPQDLDPPQRLPRRDRHLRQHDRQGLRGRLRAPARRDSSMPTARTSGAMAKRVRAKQRMLGALRGEPWRRRSRRRVPRPSPASSPSR